MAGPMTREEYENHVRQQMADCGRSVDEIERLLDRAYPKGTVAVRDELRFRSYNATQSRTDRYQKAVGLRMIGNAYAWDRSDVDAFADYLDSINALTSTAAYRRERGLTYAEQQEIEGRLAAERTTAIADGLGIDPIEVDAMLACGFDDGMRNPLNGMWSDDMLVEARGWLAENRESDEMRRTVEEIRERRGLQISG